jgi:poly-beta-1,6-N-acetyl-D-glucosamine synthase
LSLASVQSGSIGADAGVGRYVVITPARNEGSEIEQTVHSVLQQTVRPAAWVIVDDGSTDDTGAILDRFARQIPWLKVVHRKDRGFRHPGGGVVEAVLDGYRALEVTDWDFLVKLDADLVLEPNYFERCLAEFSADPKLGVGGGLVYNLANGKREIESNPAFHVRGATKIYRRDCWEGLGGLLPAPGWDTLDEVKANMLGWHTRSFPKISVLQRRATGSNDGAWKDYVKNGRANYITGYHPLFMLLKCMKRVPQKPCLVAALGLAYGYLYGYWNQIRTVQDPQLIRYVRSQQLRRLTFRESIWK